ncbi:MAG TPA: DUF2062 domain-containing protein [Allosphingosinicella sp.]|jgi:uncharacterized protein (DUF2062 family)|nr:DUF2062 domain-containing protein [Allosphingosinicella sp.]
MRSRIARAIRDNTPTLEQMQESKLIKRYAGRALHSQYWRFTRRSVPRAVGIGTMVGIFLMIPGLQIIGAALVSLPFRANVAVAGAMTFLSNPFTTPFILLASLQVGNTLGFHADLATFTAMSSQGAGVGEWLAWLLSDAAPALVAGLFIIGCVAGLVGYIVAKWIWRWRVARRWRRRVHGHRVEARVVAG